MPSRREKLVRTFAAIHQQSALDAQADFRQLLADNRQLHTMLDDMTKRANQMTQAANQLR